MNKLPSIDALRCFQTYLLEYSSSSKTVQDLRKEMKNFFSQLPVFPIQPITNNFTVLRARPNRDNASGHWRKPNQISYIKEKSNVLQCGRCNLREEVMFYGAIGFPDNMQALMTVIFEISRRMRENPENLEEFYTFGKWRLKTPIHCIPILYTDHVHKMPQILEMESRCRSFVINNFEDRADLMTDILEFIGKKFSEEHTDSRRTYEITASFCSVLLELYPEMEAILYPSMKVDGDGVNIAILPEVVDRKLLLTHMVATKATVKEKGVIDFYRVGLVKTGKTNKVVWSSVIRGVER
jgi:hypothetical protein